MTAPASRKIQIVLCEVGKPARVEHIDRKASFQEIVGGDIAITNFPNDGWLLVYAEIQHDKPFNRMIQTAVIPTPLNTNPDFVINLDPVGPLMAPIGQVGDRPMYGTFFFTKATSSGNSMSLSTKNLRDLAKFLNEPSLLPQPTSRKNDEETRP